MNTDFASIFGDFGSTNQSSFENNQPSNREYSDRIVPFIPEIKVANPPADQQSQYRIIPWPGLNYFAKQARFHSQIGPQKSQFPCLAMKGADCPCPLCIRSRKAYDISNNDMGNALAGKTRHCIWIVDRRAPHVGPQMWILPERAIASIRGQMKDPTTGQIYSVDNIVSGHDIFFTKRADTPGQSIKNINDIMRNTAATPLSEDPNQMTAWLNYIREHNDLFALLNWIDYDKMEAIAGFGNGDDDDDYDASQHSTTAQVHMPPAVANQPANTVPVSPAQPAYTAPVQQQVQQQVNPAPAQVQTPVASAQVPQQQTIAPTESDAKARLKERLSKHINNK